MEAGTTSSGPPSRPPPPAPKSAPPTASSSSSTLNAAVTADTSSSEFTAANPVAAGVQVFLLATNEKQTLPFRSDLKLKDIKLKVCTRRGLNEKDYKVTRFGTADAIDEELTLGELPSFTDRKLELQYVHVVVATSSSSTLVGKTSSNTGLPPVGTSSLSDIKTALSTERNHVLTLKVVSGKGLAAKDEGGTSDPYVSLKWNKKIFKTKVIDKNLNPTWNDSFFLGPFSAADTIKVECWDKDTLTDDFMGHFVVNLNTMEKEGTFTQWYSLVPKKKNEFVSGQIQLEFNVTHINTAAAAAEEKKKKGNWLQRRSSRAADIAPAKKTGSKSNLAAAAASATTASQPLFGVELSEVMKRYPNRMIPPPLKEAIDYIRAVGLEKEEGIFRIGGVKTGIAALRETLDSGGTIDFENVNNVHNVTGLLKMFFRELPTPLLTYDLYSRWLAIADLEGEKEQKEAISKLVEELPEVNKSLLGELCVLLHQIAKNHAVNFMDANNLSIVVGPNLIWDPTRNLDTSFSTLSQVGTIVTTMIASCPLFFPDTAALYGLTAEEASSNAVTGASSLSEILRNNAADMVSQAKTLFEYVDANGNGTLDRDEFHYFFNELMQLVNMPPPTEAEIDEAIATIDVDGNEEIDWDEFLAWWKDSHVRYCR